MCLPLHLLAAHKSISSMGFQKDFHPLTNNIKMRKYLKRIQLHLLLGCVLFNLGSCQKLASSGGNLLTSIGGQPKVPCRISIGNLLEMLYDRRAPFSVLPTESNLPLGYTKKSTRKQGTKKTNVTETQQPQHTKHRYHQHAKFMAYPQWTSALEQPTTT